jgi:hypothetical protein
VKLTPCIISMHQYNRQCLLIGWLVGDYLLLRDFVPCGIIFKNMFLLITITSGIVIITS